MWLVGKLLSVVDGETVSFVWLVGTLSAVCGWWGHCQLSVVCGDTVSCVWFVGNGGGTGAGVASDCGLGAWKEEALAIFPERARESHRQSDTQWNCFKRKR